jgi:hypothetical protein
MLGLVSNLGLTTKLSKNPIYVTIIPNSVSGNLTICLIFGIGEITVYNYIIFFTTFLYVNGLLNLGSKKINKNNVQDKGSSTPSQG